MSSGHWWEVGYPGGPMVAVPGFPRPLYWPGNPDGHKASVDGPDVVAYKRTVSRAGRWPWQMFDDSYSQSFAKGKPPGDVSESGVAGAQRQLGFAAPGTGYIGRETFNGLRSIRIPTGLPHAGEPAMDATAQNLVAEAWRMFGGAEPTGSIRELALERAINELGYVEGADNHSKYGQWYGADHQPWCAMFVTWAFEPAGSTSFVCGSRYAYCPYLYSDAQAHRYGLSLTSSPIPGDVVLYDFDGSAYDHVGIFRSGSSSSWRAIEGNTSSGSSGSQANGGGVYDRSRSRSQLVKVAFVRVAA